MDKPNTLLALLTTENPSCSYIKTDKPASSYRDKHFYTPKKIKEWEDFTYTNLNMLYDGTKIGEALKKPWSFELPRVITQDKELHDEPSTRTLYDTWNRQVVCHALESVQNELHPCTWDHKPCVFDPEVITALHPNTVRRISEKHQQRSRTGLENNAEIQNTTPVWYKRRPDVGSGMYCKKCAKSVNFERLPKDYKFAKSWNSTKLKDSQLIDADGNWIRKMDRSPLALPIRQAFTYCVDHLCRYGVLLTSKEAWIFRCQPMGNKPELEPDSEEERNVLREQLRTDGLIEYVSIGWTSHWNPAIRQEEKLTVNLALWFIHILAGNEHRAYWSLGRLELERLSPCVQSTQSNEEQRSTRAKQIANSQPGSPKELPSQNREVRLSKAKRRLPADSDNQSPREEMLHNEEMPISRYDLRSRSRAKSAVDSNGSDRANNSSRRIGRNLESESQHLQQGQPVTSKKRKKCEQTMDDYRELPVDDVALWSFQFNSTASFASTRRRSPESSERDPENGLKRQRIDAQD